MPNPRRPQLGIATALLAWQVLLCSVGCRAPDAEPAPAATPAPAAPAPGTTPAAPSATERELVVFAASSLRDAFGALGSELERAHSGLVVSFNFAGSQELRTQLEHGATADVFASADTRHMDELFKAGRVTAPLLFARNEPVVVVAEEAAASVHSLADLPGLERIVIGTPEVPIGRYTLQVLDRAAATLGKDFRARVEAKVVSRELNVKQVLTKVRLGEAQAGFVYRTDARGVAEVTVLTIPPELNVIADYPIALVTGAPHPASARAFIERVVSDAGQATLQHAGFVPVPGAER